MPRARAPNYIRCPHGLDVVCAFESHAATTVIRAQAVARLTVAAAARPDHEAAKRSVSVSGRKHETAEHGPFFKKPVRLGDVGEWQCLGYRAQLARFQETF